MTTTSIHRTAHKRRLLGALLNGPRESNSFTGGDLGNLSVAPIHIVKYLAEMVRDGLARKSGTVYSITQEGRQWLAYFDPPEAVQYEKYVPPQWNIRAGSDAHLQIRSLGVLAGARG